MLTGAPRGLPRQQPVRPQQNVFQRFSRQQEAMHFADCMNAEHRARAQVALPRQHEHAHILVRIARIVA